MLLQGRIMASDDITRALDSRRPFFMKATDRNLLDLRMKRLDLSALFELPPSSVRAHV